MGLTAYAYRVSFQRDTGRFVRGHGAWLYGSSWPRCSILVMPFNKSGNEPGRVPASAKAWLGSSYEPSEGSVTLPPKELSAWEKIGPIARIWYSRTGERGGDWDHPFGSPAGGMLRWLTGSDVFQFKGDWPTLYRRGDAHRLELGGGCVVDAYGITYP